MAFFMSEFTNNRANQDQSNCWEFIWKSTKTLVVFDFRRSYWADPVWFRAQSLDDARGCVCRSTCCRKCGTQSPSLGYVWPSCEPSGLSAVSLAYCKACTYRETSRQLQAQSNPLLQFYRGPVLGPSSALPASAGCCRSKQDPVRQDKVVWRLLYKHCSLTCDL